MRDFNPVGMANQLKNNDEKAMDASNAIQKLNADIISYTQSLKSLRDTQRNEKVSQFEDYVTAANSTYTSSSGTYYKHYRSQLNLENTSMKYENKAYAAETKKMDSDASKARTKSAKAVKKEYSSASGEYKKALQNAYKAINKKKAVSSSDLKVIGQNSNTLYAYILAYNETLNNAETTRLEQAVAYATNSAEMYENVSDKYNKYDEVSQNKIDYYELRSTNANTVKGANNNLDKAAAQYDTIISNDKKEVKTYTKQAKTNRKNILKSTGATSKLATQDSKTRKAVQKVIKKCQAHAKNGTAIGATELAKLTKYYSEGYVTDSFYASCIDYNNALENAREAEAQLKIDEQTAAIEKREYGQEEFENVQQKYQNKTNQNQAKTENIEAQQSYQTTRGIIMNEQNYRDLISQSAKDVKIYNNEIQALEDQINHNISEGYWDTSDQEYKDAMLELQSLETEIINCQTDQEEWNNAIINLPFEAIDRVLDRLTAVSDWYKANQNLNETMGIDITQKEYETQIKNLNEQIEQYQAKYNEAIKDMNKAAADADQVYGGKTVEQWYIESVQYETQATELESDVQDLINTIIDMPFKEVDRMIDSLTTMQSLLESMADLTTAQRQDLSLDQYAKQIENYYGQLEQWEIDLAQAQKDYQKALADPNGVYGGKTVQTWQDEINQYKTEIANCEISIENMKDSLRDDIIWRQFDRAHSRAQELLDVLEGISGLLDESMWFTYEGKITEFGVAEVSSLTKQINAAQTDVQNYMNDIDTLQKLYDMNLSGITIDEGTLKSLGDLSDKYYDILEYGFYSDEEYTEKMAELQEALLDSANAVQDLTNDIIDMYKTAAQYELDAINKVIDAESKALDAKKSYVIMAPLL